MRYLLALIVVIVPAITLAKPSVAVAPFEDDDGGKVAVAVEKALDKEASSVIGHKETGKTMKKLGLSGTLEKAEKKKLRRKLEVDVLVEGKVDDDRVELRISGKRVKTSRFRIDRKKLKADLPGELRKRLSPDKSDEEDEEVAAAEPERPRKRRVAEEDDEGDEVKVKKKRKKRRAADDEDEGETEEDAEPAGRHVVTQAAVLANVGAGFARRGLTYSASGNMAPPRVGTAAPMARVEIEAYPGAMESLKGIAAGFGVYGHFERALTLSIDVPGGGNTPITQQGYSIGVRYRAVFGQHAVAFGVGYAARQYTADRSGLAMNQILDMPDTSYGAVAPNVVGRFAVSPTIGLYVGGAFELLLKAGDITKTYGFARTIGFDLQGGVDVAFTPRYGLRFGTELHQVGFSFSKPQRGVSAATDRTIGLTASFEVLY